MITIDANDRSRTIERNVLHVSIAEKQTVAIITVISL
jgi:hypothetical protein